MTKLLFTAMMTLLVGNALAEIKCRAEFGQETLEIRVIDTFIERTAFISRFHPSIRFPRIGIPVKAFEKSKSVSFVNVEQDFHLTVDKRYHQRTLPPIYRADLSFGEFSTEMDCIIE